MINYNLQTKVSEEVYHSTESLLNIHKEDIQKLIKIAKETKRKRARICSHPNSNEFLQEMFIVHPKGTYVRPHKHINKSESMMILEGEVDFITFEETGEIDRVLNMGSYNTGKIFYDSMRSSIYHTLLIRSEWLVFLEITKGPFKKEDTIFASWSPEESDIEGISKFMNTIEQRLKNE
ncbi:WbuC family cupin fold metalloprotein [Leptospira santarosai]|uniref:WbuC family cupin fold metalloprotein n=1 Tax=Leptospira santarosai TaxID=28183 RepID=UPI0002BEDE5E|nr:WbuC family cupin fold metalloprotein [Leptospira santarosai]EMJ47982.1 cupin fold metalloprotein, WbuC family [Leptospira santarosai str. HAI1349]EMM85202.1 cupin fold metalloprotein, WbuC family [Leptospira santarosai str. 2000027870]MDI7182306.1 WbuC family cupin fold metalloprotein [Leptospira santarosai]MDI7198223.1 WbuC family cupin fold metalloprotein [Leptospira santarosai]MDI7205153.1 WbuC family cupin fold metalloprotein [Leptospira santarosai]